MFAEFVRRFVEQLIIVVHILIFQDVPERLHQDERKLMTLETHNHRR